MSVATALPEVHALTTRATDLGHVMMGRIDVVRCVDVAVQEAFADLDGPCGDALRRARRRALGKAQRAALDYLAALDALASVDEGEWLRTNRLFAAEFRAKPVAGWEVPA